MLKSLIFFSLISFSAFATNEPEKIIVVNNGVSLEIQFSGLKKVELETINYHVNFVNLGKIKYSGYRIRDILKGLKLSPEQSVVILGKTGQFSVELKAKELLEGDSIIATHMNGAVVQTEGNGLQIIYDEKAITKFPHLKERQHWCWWVRSLLIGDKIKANIQGQDKAKSKLVFDSEWPKPYGISTKGEVISPKEREGHFLDRFKTLKITQLNGNSSEVPYNEKIKFFVAQGINNKLGATSLHQLTMKDDKVENFVNNLYYIKSVEAIR